MSIEAKTLTITSEPARVRFLDYIELMKPELTGLSVLTALCGFYLATMESFSVWLFLHTALGTLLVGGGAGALNQYTEREYDALMKRTERRPLPSGRMLPRQALIFGAAISLGGIIELTFFVNTLTGFLGIVTWVTYLFLYTPLKRITPWSTVVGGIPGAIPPMMGWTAIRNELSVEAWILFAILFCWQMPHFYSLAWMYRQDYARAGFKILPVIDSTGKRTSRQILGYCLALLAASIAPAYFGMTGSISVFAAVVLSLAFFSTSFVFFGQSHQGSPEVVSKMDAAARTVFFGSLAYLPLLMIVFSLDKA